MKLFHISQNEINGYDTYDSAVVCAESEDAARRMHPYKGYDKETWAYGWGRDWATKPEFVEVTYLGDAAEGAAPGVICASFNAG